MPDTKCNFSIIDPAGLSANSWGVRPRKNGELYVVCRDHMKQIKVSLHKSGQHHVAFHEDSPHVGQKESRFLHRWVVPAHHDDAEFLPTFNLIFPYWGLGLTEDMRQTYPKIWGKPHVLIHAAEVPRVTVVSFVIKRRSIDMLPAPHEPTFAVPVFHLDIDPDKTLWAHIQHRGEGNLRDQASMVVETANGWSDAATALENYPTGHVFGLCVSGFDDQKIPYMMPFPAVLVDGKSNEPRRLTTPFVDASTDGMLNTAYV